MSVRSISSESPAEAFVSANADMASLRSALYAWSQATVRVRGAILSRGDLPLLGYMSDSEARDIYQASVDEQALAISVDSALSRLASTVSDHPEFRNIVSVNANAICLAAGWTGRSIRKCLQAEGRIRRFPANTGRPKPIHKAERVAAVAVRENCDFHADSPCPDCNNVCVGCGGHSPTCTYDFPMSGRCFDCSASRQLSATTGDDRTLHDEAYHTKLSQGHVAPFGALPKIERNFRLDDLGDLAGTTALVTMALHRISGWSTNY